ncbi:hypothetical protein PVK06_024695 [Gossypium arboreum]|uniref:Uncharacterized protein n=1 Tax=Gossypium arboreum TaxID=29729 RepID=A0ABR0PEM5_GOSAR|nr:hypothetical protein PVK06_024695 [Gossypium arboreum]
MIFVKGRERVDKAEVDETRPTLIHPVIEKKSTKGLERYEKKTKLVSIETDHDGEEAKSTSPPPVDATAPVPPQSTVPMIQQDREINKLIDDLTKLNDEQDKVPMNVLKRKQHYKHAARKSTRPN